MYIYIKYRIRTLYDQEQQKLFNYFPNYSHRMIPAIERSLLWKFHACCILTEKLVGTSKNGRTYRMTDGRGYIDPAVDTDQQYII